MRRDREEAEERRGRKGRGWDQVVLMLMLWFVPIGLFGYVGYMIMTVTGHDMSEYVPGIELWQVALFVSLIVISFAAFVAYRLNAARTDGRRGRFDSYETHN